MAVTKKPKPARGSRDKMPTTTAARVRRYRAKQRAAGLRLVQMWLPDTSDPKFIAEARRQSRLLRNDPQERQILAEIEAVADVSGWK